MTVFAASRLFRGAGLSIVLTCFAGLPSWAASNSQETITREFHKTLPLNPGQTLNLESKFGEVRIHGENIREARVSATIRSQSGSRAEAEKFAEAVRIEVEQDSQGVKVRTVAPSDSPIVIRIGHKNSYSVDYDITIPTDAKLWIKNGFGNVDVRTVHGWTDIENSHGQLRIRDTGAAKLTNSFGEVEAESVDGNLTIANNNARVTASSVKGTLEINDRFAVITAKNIQGAVTISGGNAPVELTDAGPAKINNSFGPVTARNIHGALSVSNSNGSIEVNTVNGSADLTGSFGSINFANVSGFVKCTGSNGRVTGNSAGAEVYVKTSFGDVSLEQVNGAVTVEDSNGAVSVRNIKGKGTFNTSFGSIEASGLWKGVKATTGNGRIALSDVTGEAYAKTSFGSVNMQRVNGNVIIENSNGAVSATAIKGDISARTSFGSITLEDISGNTTAEDQNGAILISMARNSGSCKNVSAKTSFAPIQVRIAEDGGYNLTAHTTFGRVSSELPVTSTGTISGDSLMGKIGNGGCSLSLNNSNGSIEIQRLGK